MSDPQIQPAPIGMRWDTLGTGADLWATVVMAAGFVLPAGQAVREHYRIVRTLGQGGMGQVLGVMLVGSPDQQMFALKMVARPASASNDPADQREAELQAKAFAALLRGEAAKQELVQRHGVAVARLFALVRFEDGSLGLRMEIARGQSLESFLDDEMKHRANEPPDLDWCLVVMRKVLYQLRRLHELVDPSSPAGFVHSDMKPGNVFVDDGDRYDPFVTLLDFGVATAGHALNVDQSSRAMGRKSLILHDAGGTFGFAPPHHFTGKPTPLSDVYAALVILYELLSLQSPWDFTGISKSAANLFKLEDAMRKGPRRVRTGRSAISAEHARIIDVFFRDEFLALQALADEAHEARNAPDEARRREMSERLRKLAHTYQSKLDVLRQQLTGHGAGATLSSDPSGRDVPLARARTELDASAAPLVPGAPPPPPSEALARRHAETRIDTNTARRNAEASARPSELETSATAMTRHDEPVRVPMKPLFGWKSALVLLLGAGLGAWVYLRGVPPQVRGFFGTPAPQPTTELPAVVATDAGATSATAADASPIVDVQPAAPMATPVIDAGSVTDASAMMANATLDASAFVDAGAIAVDTALTTASIDAASTGGDAATLATTTDASDATDAREAIETDEAHDAAVPTQPPIANARTVTAPATHTAPATTHPSSTAHSTTAHPTTAHPRATTTRNTRNTHTTSHSTTHTAPRRGTQHGTTHRNTRTTRQNSRGSQRRR